MVTDRKTISRRTVLRSALGVTAGALVMASAGDRHPPRPPRRALEAGLTKLRRNDSFTNLETIDLDATGHAGYTWYTRAPWGRPTSPREDFTIAKERDEVFLRVTPSVSNANWTISTMDPQTGSGTTYLHGYIEARLRFPVTPPAPDWTTSITYAWPAVWGLSRGHAFGTPGQSVELDVFEALAGPDRWTGTAHVFGNDGHWRTSPARGPNVTFARWHDYGALWAPGEITWFIDRVSVGSIRWDDSSIRPEPLVEGGTNRPGAGHRAFRAMDVTPMLFVVGSGAGAPFDLSRFRLWQN